MFHMDYGSGSIQDQAGFFSPSKHDMFLFQLSNLELFYLVTLLNEKRSNQKCLQYFPSVIFRNSD